MRIAANGIAMAAAATLICGLVPKAVAQPTPSHSFFVAHRLVEAEISTVDRDAGVLFLKTQAGRLKLGVPVESMTGLRKGGRVLLDLTVIRHPDPAGLPREGGPRRPPLVQSLRAEIAAIQRGIGVVSLTSSVGRLNIDLPDTAIAGLRTGDHLALELRFASETDVSTPREPDNYGRRVGLAAFLFGLTGRHK